MNHSLLQFAWYLLVKLVLFETYEFFAILTVGFPQRYHHVVSEHRRHRAYEDGRQTGLGYVVQERREEQQRQHAQYR